MSETKNSDPANLLEIAITRVGGRYSFCVRGKTNPLLDFDIAERQVSSKPAKNDLPFFYEVRFLAINFSFHKEAENAVQWTAPVDRPPFIAEPVISADGATCGLKCVNAAWSSQVVNFKLIPLDEALAVIDPTIVNNPDGPPPPDPIS